MGVALILHGDVSMFRRTTVWGAGALAVLALGCSESAGPERNALRPPALATAASTGIVLDQSAGVAGETGIEIGQGFNPTNPHRGDAIIATFFWAGSTNTITKVFDHLSDADDAAATVVGNTYTLVEYVTAGGISMATYVATNVQNFPDPNPDDRTVVDLGVRSEYTDHLVEQRARAQPVAAPGVHGPAEYDAALGHHPAREGHRAGRTGQPGHDVQRPGDDHHRAQRRNAPAR